MVIITYREIEKFVFGPIVRLYVAGKSGSGKTSFVKKLLQSNLINYNRVYYFHPDFYESSPINWHESLRQEVIYKSELPKLECLKDMPPNSVIVLDDVFDQVENCKTMDYLFRVLSGKYSLHVIVMTQRYYSGGRFCNNIRNCCDYHVLMRNSDQSLTKRIARSLGHSSDITAAQSLTENDLYPYIFVDKTQLAHVNKLQVFIDILSRRKIVVFNSMKYYLISEADFNSSYKKVDKNLASNEIEKPGNKRKGAKSRWKYIENFEAKRKKAIEGHVRRALYKLKKRSQL